MFWGLTYEFWISVAVNIVLTLTLGVVATIIAPVAASRVSNFFYTRRARRTLKRRTAELRDYEQTKAFHEGKKDKQFYYVFMSTLSITFMMISLAAGSILTITNDWPEVVAGNQPSRLLPLVLASCAFFGFLFAAVFLAATRVVASRLENFDAYEKQVKERWPDALI